MKPGDAALLFAAVDIGMKALRLADTHRSPDLGTIIAQLSERGPTVEAARYTFYFATRLVSAIAERGLYRDDAIEHHELTLLIAVLIPMTRRQAGIAENVWRDARPST
jgi:hypothetical protein